MVRRRSPCLPNASAQASNMLNRTCQRQRSLRDSKFDVGRWAPSVLSDRPCYLIPMTFRNQTAKFKLSALPDEPVRRPPLCQSRRNKGRRSCEPSMRNKGGRRQESRKSRFQEVPSEFGRGWKKDRQSLIASAGLHQEKSNVSLSTQSHVRRSAFRCCRHRNHLRLEAGRWRFPAMGDPYAGGRQCPHM